MAYKEVVGLFQKQADEIYYVHIGDEIIEVTGEHPFWLDGKGWTFVKDLKVGDLLVSSDGSKLAIDKIEKESREATVYNFEVEDFNSYFVSNLGIWVHNCEVNGAGKLSPIMIELHTKLDDLAEKHLLPQFREIDPNLKSGYTGSFKTGTVGNPSKPTYGQPINMNKYDIDYFIESDILYEKFGNSLKANPVFRKILSEIPGFEGLKPNKEGFSIKFKPSSN
nr:polymorphic toxin-type HINT domain-containing protein [Paenibacillus algorifonticola]